LHPHEALLQQAREVQRSPAFAEARRRRQVVEHRIARLVQLGIRQARYFGRTKTLFQVCLAAAVANLTLLATASDTFRIALLYTVQLLILAIAASLCVAFVASLVTAAVGASTLNADRIRPTVPDLQRSQAGSRPAF
jgi:Transposase DDE domain